MPSGGLIAGAAVEQKFAAQSRLKVLVSADRVGRERQLVEDRQTESERCLGALNAQRFVNGFDETGQSRSLRSVSGAAVAQPSADPRIPATLSVSRKSRPLVSKNSPAPGWKTS